MESIFSHTVSNGKIWKIFPLPDKTQVLLEVREAAERKVSFTVVDYVQDKILWNNVLLEEPWWVTLYTCRNQVLEFIHYLDAENPGQKVVVGIDLNTKKKLWVREFEKIEKGNSVGFATQKDYLGEQERHFRSEGKKKEGSPEIFRMSNPFHYQENTPEFKTVARFIQLKKNVVAVGNIEYLEKNGLIFVGYYYYNEGCLINNLLVLLENGKELTSRILGEDLKGFGSDTFFLVEDYLFFVKNKTTFEVLFIA